MQDWSEAKKRILKPSESDLCSDLSSISYQVKKIIESSLVSTIQVALIATFSKYTSGMPSQQSLCSQEGVRGGLRSGAGGRDTPCREETSPLMVSTITRDSKLRTVTKIIKKKGFLLSFQIQAEESGVHLSYSIPSWKSLQI